MRQDDAENTLFDLPAAVTLHEVGPRDGFQNERRVLDTDTKLEIIAGLAAAGLREIQATSFVHPAKVPQMADAESLVARLPAVESVVYTALALNRRGVERAAAAGIGTLEVSISVSDAQSRDNTGMDHRRALAEGRRMIQDARAAEIRVQASIQCTFGCLRDSEIDADRVAHAADRLLAEGIERLILADTTGMADPRTVAAMIDRLRPAAAPVPLALHLHDTRGLGLVNLFTALARGVTRFDTALGGMGGCPFVAGAAGNIPTEDTAHLLDRLGVATGVDIAAVARQSRRLAELFARRFAGRLYPLV